MPASKTIPVILIIAVLITTCVEPFTPDIKESQELMVVEGLLTDQPGYQYIYVSRSSPFSNPELLPEEQCLVMVVDDKGNSYLFSEQEPGAYSCWMTRSRLIPGTAYKLIIHAGKGKAYESDYELLQTRCPSIDSVYFEIENRETSDPEQPMQGIQFYIDLEAGEDQPRNYRWELVETWEYYAAHYIQYYYDGALHYMPDPMLYYKCWYTGRISNIYTMSTKQMLSNKIHKYPLNYVSNRTNRLRIRYSLFVKQYTLSDDAFAYWDQMRKQNQEGGGFYEKQPSQIQGNIYNIDDPDEKVLGFFNVSSATEKRIYVDDINEFNFPGPDCVLDTIMRLSEIPDYISYPVYMISLSDMGSGPPYGIGHGMCFDCTTGGGTNVKPDFWE
jgi:hypothetical protein